MTRVPVGVDIPRESVLMGPTQSQRVLALFRAGISTTVREMAQKTGLHASYFSAARTLHDEAPPEYLQAVESGLIPLPTIFRVFNEVRTATLQEKVEALERYLAARKVSKNRGQISEIVHGQEIGVRKSGRPVPKIFAAVLDQLDGALDSLEHCLDEGALRLAASAERQSWRSRLIVCNATLGGLLRRVAQEDK